MSQLISAFVSVYSNTVFNCTNPPLLAPIAAVLPPTPLLANAQASTVLHPTPPPVLTATDNRFMASDHELSPTTAALRAPTTAVLTPVTALAF